MAGTNLRFERSHHASIMAMVKYMAQLYFLPGQKAAAFSRRSDGDSGHVY
jgi:hypothetical protein